MRSCLLFVYWALLLTSVLSSGLLFLIVASENTHVEEPFSLSEKNETHETYNNVTFIYNNEESFESSDIVNAEIQSRVTFKNSQNDRYHQEKAATVSTNLQTITDDNAQREKDLDVLAESLTQQPNLSQGISETGQAVVLTLVDTAAAELQSLSEPKINRDFHSRSYIKNSSLLSGNVRQSDHLDGVPPATQIPPPPIVDETTEQSNDSNIPEEEGSSLLRNVSEESAEVVVIVRAEQKINAEELELGLQEEVSQVTSEELPKDDDILSTASELNDTAARAQLVGSSRDETAAVILDGFVTSGPTDQHEDIPSFSEWAQKRLEEAEKKKTHPNASVQTPGGPARGIGGMKVRSKNYASPDCGAKIVAANPEARSAKNVLVSTRDEYMLNTCTSRVWFVVELCEAIQAKKIELANFELFSSSPKDFSVYVSDRFPTRDWSPVGQFTAKDVKDVQNFALHPHFFGKFIKLEFQSHYGSEHFCPVSLFRAYGTSEFEVLETETENQILQEESTEADDDESSDEEELLNSDGDDPSRNLFGSARDAVLSIVKKAAEVLVKSSDLTGNNITEIQQSITGDDILDNSYTSCMTPRYTILCGNCSDQKFASVFQLVSCRDRQLDDLLKIDLINRTLRRSALCGIHSMKTELSWKENEEELAKTKREYNTRFDLVQDLQARFLMSVFKPEYIAALCNVLATKERKVVMNTSYEIPMNTSDDTLKEDILLSTKGSDQSGEVISHHQVSATCISDSNSPACKPASPKDNRRRIQDTSVEAENVSTASIETSTSAESLASQIKPTKTLSKEDLKKESSIPILEPSKETTEETQHAEVLTTILPSSDLPTPTLNIMDDPAPVLGTSVDITTQTVTTVPLINLDNQETSDTFTPDMESSDSGMQGKTEKFESGEQDGQQAKDLNEQEIRLSSQDHLALDTLLSDLKDLESDPANMQNGASSFSSMAPPTASTVPQKESVFLRLSNRIKALERNMSLSGQYLEELSRRYKKQVEEMQRSLERAIFAKSEESRKGEEREAKRAEEIAFLKQEIVVLSKSMESLLYDRDSWRGRISTIVQHALLICLEVTVIILILSYCRRTGDFEENEKIQSSGKRESVRRKSAENFSSHVASKKMKKRRPSETASRITGTYHELMIDDRETKKERKKKRKKEANGTRIVNADAKREAARYKSVLDIMPGGTTLPSRRASSIDPPRSKEEATICKRPESAPETTLGWFNNQPERIERIAQPMLETKIFGMESEQNFDLNHQADELSETSSFTMDRCIKGATTVERKVESSKNSSFKTSGILKSARLSSPSFMKTALGTRRKRKPSLNSERWDWSHDSEHSNDKSNSPISSAGTKMLSQTINSVNGNTTNGLIEESDDSRSSTATPTSGKKEKRSSGLKKMVKKFF